MQRDFWYSTARKRDRLEDPEAVGRKAAARAVRRLGARKRKSVEVPVTFAPDPAASLLRSIAGAASGPSLYRRASFLLDRLGTKIAAPTVTIVDDALIPSALGSRPFDGEGLATGRTVLVREGVLESYLLDTYSARKLGLASTHHAGRDGAGVSVTTTNLMLLPGKTTPQELIGSVRNGFYVTELIGFGVNGVTGDYSRGAAGLWIENGELAYPVEEVTIAGNLLDMFGAIDGVGNDLVLRDRTASPTVKVARMVVALGEVGLPWYSLDGAADAADLMARGRVRLDRLLALAARWDLAVALHAPHAAAVGALDALRRHGIERAVFHWHKAPEDVTRAIVDAGYFVSVTPEVVYRDRDREMVAAVPLDALLVESDAPWKYRGEFEGLPSGPWFAGRVGEEIAKIKQLPVEDVMFRLSTNTCRLFDLVWR